jgi:hypothetical protein
MKMKHRTAAGLALATVSFGATPALGEFRLDRDGLTGDFGDVQPRGRLGASVQASSFSSPEDPTAGTDTDTAIDGSVRLSMRYTADNAWRFGIVADFDSVEQSIERLERDEFHVYALSESGRIGPNRAESSLARMTDQLFHSHSTPLASGLASCAVIVHATPVQTHWFHLMNAETP